MADNGTQRQITADNFCDTGAWYQDRQTTRQSACTIARDRYGWQTCRHTHTHTHRHTQTHIQTCKQTRHIQRERERERERETPKHRWIHEGIVRTYIDRQTDRHGRKPVDSR